MRTSPKRHNLLAWRRLLQEKRTEIGRLTDRQQRLEDAALTLLRSVYVGEGKVVCPPALLPGIRALYEAMK